MRYYHVASETYTEGEDLLCWNNLMDAGIVTEEDWKWDEAPVGFDGHVVCLYATLAEAENHRAEYGGTIFAVDIEDDDDRVRMTRVGEGFPAAVYSIPADCINTL